MKVPIDKLAPGMMLARDLTNLAGGLLLTKGTELTPQLLATLKRFELTSIHVAGETDQQSAEAQIAPEILCAAEKRVDLRFTHLSPANPDVVLIRELAVKRTASRLGQGFAQCSSDGP